MAFQTQAPTGASPGCSAFPNRSVACSEYPKWIILCHVYRGCPGLLVCFGLFVPHMTRGQVFILVKGDPREGKCIMLASQERWWPRGKVTAVGDYLINVVVQCSGQSPRTGFRVREAVCSGRWWLWHLSPLAPWPPRASQDAAGRAAAWLLCCSPRIANPAKIRARQLFCPFYKAGAGIWAVWWVLSPAPFEELGREFVTGAVPGSPCSSVLPPSPGPASLSGSLQWLLTAARTNPSPFLSLLQTLLSCVGALNGLRKKKKKATVWNERRVQMRWAQTEGKCFWKGNRWEEEKHRRLLISSLVLFSCYVCFMFPSSDWRDYRLCRFYVQVPLMWPNFMYFIGDNFPSFFLPSPAGEADCGLFSLPSHRPALQTEAPQLQEKSVLLSHSICSFTWS